jgi:hypothetical protein
VDAAGKVREVHARLRGEVVQLNMTGRPLHDVLGVGPLGEQVSTHA